jgi:alkanesulfonate monooxygenase SsuD/methylene tetrahydromethanopterin reductase-like flavin-dependent oxidoreductase (luciferase family)
MWTEPLVNFEGRYYQLSQTYCEPKPLQKPTPPFIIGGNGEQLTLRVVAQYANVWNFPGVPGLSHGAVEEFQHRNHVLDGYCAEIDRDPASLARSVQIIIDPRENPAPTRQVVQSFIAAGATHLVLAPRRLDEGIAHWLSEEIIEPVRKAAGDNVPGGEQQER